LVLTLCGFLYTPQLAVPTVVSVSGQPIVIVSIGGYLLCLDRH